MVWGKAGSTTLTSAGDTLTVSGMTASKLNQSIVHLPRSGNIGEKRTYNNNTNSVYAHRRSANGGSEVTPINQANTDYNVFAGFGDFFIVNYICSVVGEEKLSIEFVGSTYTAGAGTAPDRAEFVAKFVPSPDSTITRIDYNNTESGSYDTNTNLSVLGSDITPASAIPFPENVELGSRAEITDTRKMYNLTDNPTIEDAFTSSTGWTQVTNTASGVSGGELIGLTNSSGTNGAGAWKDYGLVSDTKFVLRCKFQIVTQSGGSGNASTLYFGLSDTNGATSPHSARDGFGIAITNYAASGMLWTYPNNATWDNADTDLSLTPTQTTYYLEIARTSATSVTFKLFSDEYSTVVKTHTQTIASTLNGLRYLMFQEWRNGSGNTTKVAVDDLKIYNDTSSVSSFTPYWKEIGA